MIRLQTALSTCLFVAACASAPVDSERAARPACDQTLDCFYERNIRSFQVLNDETIVVLVGRDECPFKVELEGFFCDMSMSTFLEFNDADGRICTWDRTRVASGPFARNDEYCRVRRVTPMTDDELLEAYATSGLTPPPPAKGSGQIQVLQTQPEAAPQEPSEAQGADGTAEGAERPGTAVSSSEGPEPGPPEAQ